jgi:hypothetical protein
MVKRGVLTGGGGGRGVETTESERGEAVKINFSQIEIILSTIYNKLFNDF